MENLETSTEENEDVPQEEKNVRIFATQMLKSRIFMGHFQEKRYVETLGGYRDVILVDDREQELKNDLDVVRKRLRTVYNSCWIGLTTPNVVGVPVGHCLWVDSEEYPYGMYWYRIKGVRFRQNEIILKIKKLRVISDETQSPQANQDVFEMLNDYFQNFCLESTLQNIKNTLIENLIWFFTNVLTINNIKEAITFVTFLAVTSVALSVKGIGFMMDFSLKFMRETSYFIQASTPVMIAVVNLIGRVVGGFYLLIAMILGEKPKPQNYRPINAINYPRVNRKQSSVIITEVD